MAYFTVTIYRTEWHIFTEFKTFSSTFCDWNKLKTLRFFFNYYFKLQVVKLDNDDDTQMPGNCSQQQMMIVSDSKGAHSTAESLQQPVRDCPVIDKGLPATARSWLMIGGGS